MLLMACLPHVSFPFIEAVRDALHYLTCVQKNSISVKLIQILNATAEENKTGEAAKRGSGSREHTAHSYRQRVSGLQQTAEIQPRNRGRVEAKVLG